MASECTQESVLDFLLENGGRVKNKDLIAHFKVFLSSENTKRAVLKERFKRFVDNIAYVKQENGEKVVCLKKKYRYPEMRSGRALDEKPDDEEKEDDEDVKRGLDALQIEENGNVKAEIDGKHDLNQKSEEKADDVRDAECEEVCVSDIALIEKDSSALSHCNLPEGSLENVPGNDVESNVPELSNAQSTGQPESRAGELELEAPLGKASVTSQVIISRRRTSRGSQRSLLGSSEDGTHDGQSEEGSTPKGSRKNFIELMMSSSPQVRLVQIKCM